MSAPGSRYTQANEWLGVTPRRSVTPSRYNARSILKTERHRLCAAVLVHALQRDRQACLRL